MIVALAVRCGQWDMVLRVRLKGREMKKSTDVRGIRRKPVTQQFAISGDLSAYMPPPSKAKPLFRRQCLRSPGLRRVSDNHRPECLRRVSHYPWLRRLD